MSTTTQTWSRKRTITAGIIGNVLEWYDFGVYGFFASIIAVQFFPSDNPSVSLIAAFGAFAAGFLMRPVGGAIFGHIGDRYGRARAMQLSVMCMAVPTFLIGLLPTYETIGVAAAILMVLLRMIQGVAVGGEYTSSIVFLAESAPAGRRAFFTSWSMFGATGGTLLGSAVGALLSNSMDAEALTNWGWRVAFLAGISVSLVGFFIRRGLAEQPVIEHQKPPLLEAFKSHGKAIFRVVGLNVVNAVTFYLIFVYVVTWLVKNVHETRSEALAINTVSMVLLLALLPLFAKLSDAWGRKKLILIGTGGIAVLAFPLLKLMHHHDAGLILAGQMGFVVLVACYAASLPAIMTEMFPQKIRVTAVSVSYNITFALLGGTSPIVAVWLIERTHDDLAFAWYIVLAAVISFLFALGVTDRRNEPLS
jgi:MHS family proline/betaine transporter-like MFS transporter